MGNSKSTTIFSSSDPKTWSSLLTLDQASMILNVSPWTLRQWDNQKKLVAIRIGTRKDRRYRKEDVLKALNEGI
ncbi:MAG TPA: helix-turn-helix domain-containing protein [Candidatus Woesebacteria bacterium]|nr:helix-turn-helix domain-containing protein [Candidatus Woesebacteria bacterium]